MLTRLQIRNFAIIDSVEVEFASGMTVLTGETGAGKSILVDALGLVLGERGGAALLRPGAKRAEFTAGFDLADNPDAAAWLNEQALDVDQECLLRRVIGEDGRSRAFINGNAVPLQSLKDLGEKLLDIHGQHFHQSLARRGVQRDLLDHFGGLQTQRVKLADAYRSWQDLAQKLKSLQDADADRAARIDLLSFQTQELERLDPQPDEQEALLAEREKLRNSGVLADGVSRALDALFDSDTGNAQNLLAAAANVLESASRLDAELRSAHALVEEASIQVSEAADALRRYGDSLDTDPGRRDLVEERLDAIQAVARKHRVEARELPDLERRLLAELSELSDAESTGARLSSEAADAKNRYRQAAAALSASRRKAAKAFAAQVTGAMHGLGMPGGVFDIALKTLDEAQAGPAGMDDVEFLISANPGQLPLPLAKIASGGELSRMSLAIQVIGSDGSAIPTMVFDEVDSGVGGGVAEMVGRRLKALGVSRQVLCVTHLPQVASLADHHLRIAKSSDGRTTRTEVTPLSRDERVEELARMLGGVRITRRTRDHAAEMLDAV